MNSKNGYFHIDYTTSVQRLNFHNVPQKYINHALHYVMKSSTHQYYSTENIKFGYWYTKPEFIPLEFDSIKLYAFDMDTGVECIDEYNFKISDFNFMFNLKTDNIDEANIWAKYIDLFNKVHNTRFKYGVNITLLNENYDNYEISRQKYNFIYSFPKNELEKIQSIDIIKKLIGNI